MLAVKISQMPCPVCLHTGHGVSHKTFFREISRNFFQQVLGLGGIPWWDLKHPCGGNEAGSPQGRPIHRICTGTGVTQNVFTQLSEKKK